MSLEDLPPEARDQLGAIHRLARDHRSALRLNLRDAAEQIGIAFNSLSRFERGYAPDAPGLLAILRWLGLPLAWLDDDPDPGAAVVGERWAYWRGWRDCAQAHRDAVDRLAPLDPPARMTPEFQAWLVSVGGRDERYPEDEITGYPDHVVVDGDHSGCRCGGDAP